MAVLLLPACCLLLPLFRCCGSVWLLLTRVHIRVRLCKHTCRFCAYAIEKQLDLEDDDDWEDGEASSASTRAN